MTVTCQVPTFASNGPWQVALWIVDGTNGGYYKPGLRTTLEFQVAGGTEDSSPPRMVEYRTEPTLSDVSWSCRAVPGITELGPHRAQVTARDALGHSRVVELWIEIT